MNEDGFSKLDIRSLSLEEIEGFFSEIGEKPFRAAQLYQWLWEKSAHSFDEMTNLSVSTRNKLKKVYDIYNVTLGTCQKSKDKTIKTSFSLFDGNVVEGVLIPVDDRMTACISSQVGCSLTCSFCATGLMDRKRNLSAAEIYDQVIHIRNLAEENYQTPLTNIVYMGMGEPLLNYANVLKSVEYITSPKGLNMSPKRITVSTAGIAKMIKKLGDDEVKFRLALSLHAANDEKRNKIMPINESNNLEVLKDALNYFYEKTGNRITLEYIVFKDFNDELTDANELVQFAKEVDGRVNIIEYNPVASLDFKNTSVQKMDAFINFLERKGVGVTVRRSRGKDIDAACGQLANKEGK